MRAKVSDSLQSSQSSTWSRRFALRPLSRSYASPLVSRSHRHVFTSSDGLYASFIIGTRRAYDQRANPPLHDDDALVSRSATIPRNAPSSRPSSLQLYSQLPRPPIPSSSSSPRSTGRKGEGPYRRLGPPRSRAQSRRLLGWECEAASVRAGSKGY
jgi:hypothetical protein